MGRATDIFPPRGRYIFVERMGEPLITYKGVEVRQQELSVLTGVDLELCRGEFVYFIGKVGTGKTSLLKTIYAELDVANGQANVLGIDMRRIKRKHVPQLRRRIGIVFQDFQLLTDRSVNENLEFVLRGTGWKSKADIRERIAQVLSHVGMDDKGRKMPNELSGGEQQRIVIARAMLNRPDIILADEPTGNRDVETGRSIVRLLYELSQTGVLVIVTTHNLRLLDEFPGKVYRFAEHKVEPQPSEPQALETPTDETEDNTNN